APPTKASLLKRSSACSSSGCAVQVLGLEVGLPVVRCVDLEVDLRAVDRDSGRRPDAETYLRTFDGYEDDFDVITDDDALARLARQDEHETELPGRPVRSAHRDCHCVIIPTSLLLAHRS